MKKITYIIVFLIVTATTAKAQQGFGTSSPAPTSVVDMTATNKGALLPRVTLTGTADGTTILLPAKWLTVFNTATTALGTANDVTPGYYYWNGTQWVRLLTGTDAWTTKGNTGTNSSTSFLGTTDTQDLVFKTKNTEHLRITQTGRLVFANTTGGANMSNIFINGGNEATTGNRNVSLGFNAFANNTTGSANLAIGTAALSVNTTGSNNISMGYISLQNNTTGGDNVAIGQSALINNTAGNMNIAIGTRALQLNKTSTTNNTTSNNNVAIGYNALGVTTTGANNTAIGYLAGYGTTGNTTGSNNTFIGANTTFPTATASNQLNIANNIFGTGLTGSGASPAGFIGIGTTTPKSTLQVKGSISDTLRVIKDLTITTVTLTQNDYTILKTGAAAAVITIVLPDAATCPGRVYRIIDYQGASGSTTFSRNIQTVDFTHAYTSADLYELVSNVTGATAGHLLTLSIQSDGTDWYSIGM